MPSRVIHTAQALVDVVVGADGTRSEHVGGSPLNVAVGLARLDHQVTLATHFGRDAHGAAIGEHLAEAGVEVLLLERGEFGAGSTCRAAGGVRAAFSDPVNVQLGQRSLRAFEDFGRRPGGQIDLAQHGYLFLLSDPADVAEFERGVRMQAELGVPARMLSVAQARQLSPFITGDGLEAAALSASGGHCTPEAVVQGYARGARSHGAVLQQRCALSLRESC